MTQHHLLAILISLMAVGATQGQSLIQSPPQEPKEGTVDYPYGGTVTRITKDSITIQWTNSSGEKPKTFALSETLTAGKVPLEPRSRPGERPMYSVAPVEMYRVTDVKVGDGVLIRYSRVKGVDICDHIRIMIRPNGLVPPLPKEAEDLRDPRMRWRARFKGKPIPPEIEEGIKNWPFIPYHERMNAYWAKVAPMPREVKPLTSK